MTKKYLIFQLDGTIDDPINGDKGREAYYQIKRKVSDEHINEAFAQGFYQYTWGLYAEDLNEVYATLNQDNRPTGQFCPSLSVGDLIYKFDAVTFYEEWHVVDNVGFRRINLTVLPWKFNGYTECDIIFFCKDCSHTINVPMMWVDRFIKASLKAKNYHRCPKCRIVDRHGIDFWEANCVDA